jgi:tetratricopeptide (TPR) repeat protein
MEPGSPTSAALPLLAQLYRERRSGLLSVGQDDSAVHVVLREGQVVGLGPVPPPEPARPALPPPDDSARIRLEQVLVEVGIRRRPKPAPSPPAVPAAGARDRLLRALADRSGVATFEEGVAEVQDVAETTGATEPLILEAVQAIGDPGEVREALGDLDRGLTLNVELAEERTLTLTEGYILSRIDGTASAREILQLVPLDPGETERTLLGLLLTGRVAYRAAPVPPARRLEPVAPPPAEAEPLAEDAARTEESGSPREEDIPVFPREEDFPVFPREEDFPVVSLVEDGEPEANPELDPEELERKKEIAAVFQSMHSKNHFEVLGLEPGCTDADVKRAYASLVKRFHPDAHGDPRLETILAAILMRAREAFEVLGTSLSRSQYEAKSGIVRPPRESPFTAASAAPRPPAAAPRPPAPAPAPSRAAPAASSVPDYVPPEELLRQARILLSTARYWDVIQVLENAVPQMEPRRAQHKARILLAKAYAKNPKWVRRALEYLDEVVREDPASIEAHYELGLLYKELGQPARAQAAFRRVLDLKPEHREAAAELGLDSARPAGGGLLKRLLGRGKAS